MRPPGENPAFPREAGVLPGGTPRSRGRPALSQEPDAFGVPARASNVSVAIVPYDRMRKEELFQTDASAHVVQNQRCASSAVESIRDKTNVKDPGSQLPGNDVAWMVIGRITRSGKRLAIASEEAQQIEHSPVVNVRIRPRKAPILWIGVEVRSHVVVYEDLKVIPKCPIGSDQHV